MTTNEMKRILVNKLHEEGTGFTFKDVSITNAPMPMTTSWNEEKDDWNIEYKTARKVVIKGYEHIHFFITQEVDDYFGNEVWVYSKMYSPKEGTYLNEGGSIVTDSYGKNTGFDELVKEVLVRLGYYIGSRF